MVSFPLPPQHLAQLSSHPLVQLFKRPPNLGQLEVIAPASQDRVQFVLDEPIEPAASCPAKAFLKLLSDPFHRPFGHFEPWLDVKGYRVAKEFTLPGTRHRALLQIHLELEPAFEKISDRCQYALPGPARVYMDVAIIRVAAKPQPPAL